MGVAVVGDASRISAMGGCGIPVLAVVLSVAPAVAPAVASVAFRDVNARRGNHVGCHVMSPPVADAPRRVVRQPVGVKESSAAIGLVLPEALAASSPGAGI